MQEKNLYLIPSSVAAFVMPALLMSTKPLSPIVSFATTAKVGSALAGAGAGAGAGVGAGVAAGAEGGAAVSVDCFAVHPNSVNSSTSATSRLVSFNNLFILTSPFPI